MRRAKPLSKSYVLLLAPLAKTFPANIAIATLGGLFFTELAISALSILILAKGF